MGKNAGHKQMQMSRHGGDGGADGQQAASDGLVDASFHTAEWHAARIASLTVERPAYEDWRLKRKEEEGKLNMVAEEEEQKMREYRALLDSDRARRLGRAPPSEKKEKSSKRKKDKKEKKDKKSKDKKHKKEKKSKKSKSSKKKRRHDDSDSSSSGSSESESDSSDSDREAKRTKKSKGDKEGKADSPDYRLSEFFKH